MKTIDKKLDTDIEPSINITTSKSIRWSYEEDMIVLNNPHMKSKELEKLLPLRKADAITKRVFYLRKKGYTKESMQREKELFEKYKHLDSGEIVEKLKLSIAYVLARLEASYYDVEEMKKIVIDRKAPLLDSIEIEPMKNKIIYKPAPKGSLNTLEIKKDMLQEGKSYKIEFKKKLDGNKWILVQKELTCIGCYPNLYLLKDKKGLRHTLNKVDQHIGLWKVIA